MLLFIKDKYRINRTKGDTITVISQITGQQNHTAAGITAEASSSQGDGFAAVIAQQQAQRADNRQPARNQASTIVEDRQPPVTPAQVSGDIDNSAELPPRPIQQPAIQNPGGNILPPGEQALQLTLENTTSERTTVLNSDSTPQEFYPQTPASEITGTQAASEQEDIAVNPILAPIDTSSSDLTEGTSTAATLTAVLNTATSPSTATASAATGTTETTGSSASSPITNVSSRVTPNPAASIQANTIQTGAIQVEPVQTALAAQAANTEIQPVNARVIEQAADPAFRPTPTIETLARDLVTKTTERPISTSELTARPEQALNRTAQGNNTTEVFRELDNNSLREVLRTTTSQLNQAVLSNQVANQAASQTSSPVLSSDTAVLPNATGLAATSTATPAVATPLVDTSQAGETGFKLNNGLSSYTVQTPVGSTNWAAEVGNRVQLLAKGDIGTAELQLNPESLGRLEVKITTEDDKTTVSFFSSSANARDALESAMPKLRDLLASQGLELSHSDVSERSLAEHNQQSFGRGTDEAAGYATESSEIETNAELPARSLNTDSSHLVDYYI